MTINPNFGKLIAAGKTKKIYACPDNNDLVYIVSKDDITAGDGTRRNQLLGKSYWSTATTANVFSLLNDKGIATHFIKHIDANTLLVKRCLMLPIEQVQRRIATGSYLKSHPEIIEGSRFDPVVVETFLKNDALHDPKISPAEIIEKGLATADEIMQMADEGRKIFVVLEEAWQNLGIVLADLKIEFGKDSKGNIILADVVDNDSWRLWPSGDKSRMLDKQIYRNLKEVTEQDLQNIAHNYQLVTELSCQLKQSA